MRKRRTFQIIALAFAAIFFGGVGGAIFALMRDLPQIRELENYSPSAVTRIYSADHELLAELYVEKRDPIAIRQMPDMLKAALITTEDRQFYSHSGLDLKGIVRAVVHDIMAGGFVQGASTITQQLAKTLFLTPEKSLERKLKEAVLAFQLERRYTKEEILERYFNQVYFGSGAYGIKMAAAIYFAKPVSDLNLAECALLAGLPKAPSVYSPLVNPELAVKRRDIVLVQMRDTGQITTADYAEAAAIPYSAPPKRQRPSTAPYFVDYIKKQLESSIGSAALYRGGLIVHTTLSARMQAAAEKAVETGLLELSHRMARNKIIDPAPQSALVAIDVQTGGILAMVGGRSYSRSPFNRAANARRQPGSAFKPLVFAYGIEHGFTQASLLLDAPIAFPGARADLDWQPENFSAGYQGEISFRKALTHSENIPAVRLLGQLGPSAVISFARRCGIASPMSPNLSLALGAFETTLLELTAAYGLFPNRGTYAAPYGITEVRDSNDREIWRVAPEKRLVMSRAGAAIMTDILKGTIEEGTGRFARDIGRPLGGKTGTTNKYRDALFVGFSPTVATGVWTGNDNFTPLGPSETGARAALPIWKAFMEDILSDRPAEFFDFPDDIVRVRMDPDTGRILEDHKAGVPALFRKSEIER